MPPSKSPRRILYHQRMPLDNMIPENDCECDSLSHLPGQLALRRPLKHTQTILCATELFERLHVSYQLRRRYRGEHNPSRKDKRYFYDVQAVYKIANQLLNLNSSSDTTSMSWIMAKSFVIQTSDIDPRTLLKVRKLSNGLYYIRLMTI
jgi:hypothetical protein